VAAQWHENGLYLGASVDRGYATRRGFRRLDDQRVVRHATPFIFNRKYGDWSGNEESYRVRRTWSYSLFASYKFLDEWGIQAGYDYTQLILYRKLMYPFAWPTLDGNVNRLRLTHTFSSWHVAAQYYAYDPIYVQLGLRIASYDEGPSGGRTYSRINSAGSGYRYTTTVKPGPQVFLSPEVGFYHNGWIHVGLAYNLGLRNIYSEEFTALRLGRSEGTNRLIYRNDYLALKLSVSPRIPHEYIPPAVDWLGEKFRFLIGEIKLLIGKLKLLIPKIPKRKDVCDLISERGIQYQPSVDIGTSATLQMEVFDSHVIDGDIISVCWNNTVVLKKHVLTRSPLVIPLQTQAGLNELRVFVHNEGTRSPNTVAFKFTTDTGATFDRELLAETDYSEALILIRKE